MKLKIKFGSLFELERVKYTISKLGRYNSQRYKPKLPEGIKENTSQKRIQNQIKKEYDEKRYKEIAKEIAKDFSRIESNFSKKLNNLFDKEIPKTFFVYLTNYGVGGSYRLPNKIIFNINNKKRSEVIVHEIIHLIIEPYIKKYNVSHWEKERIVDLILNSKEFSFLKYGFWQRDYRGVEKYIDNLFNNHFFKDPESFFPKIVDIRPK